MSAIVILQSTCTLLTVVFMLNIWPRSNVFAIVQTPVSIVLKSFALTSNWHTAVDVRGALSASLLKINDDIVEVIITRSTRQHECGNTRTVQKKTYDERAGGDKERK